MAAAPATNALVGCGIGSDISLYGLHGDFLGTARKKEQSAHEQQEDDDE